jgi:hypothetical protein
MFHIEGARQLRAKNSVDDKPEAVGGLSSTARAFKRQLSRHATALDSRRRHHDCVRERLHDVVEHARQAF